MNNKETYSYIEERKKLLERFKQISADYPLSENYKRMVVHLGEEIANLSEQLYKKEA
jgi:hypothetical protein